MEQGDPGGEPETELKVRHAGEACTGMDLAGIPHHWHDESMSYINRSSFLTARSHSTSPPAIASMVSAK